MFGTNIYGTAPYGAVTVHRKVVIITDLGSGTSVLGINAILIIDETGSGDDFVSGGTDKRVADFGSAVSVINIVATVHITDIGQLDELLGGRRWVMQKLDNQTWIATTATGTWTEKTKTSQVWTEKDEIE